MNTNANQYQEVVSVETGRSRLLDDLACEQAILNCENETDMSEDLAAELNAGSFRTRGEQNFFKNTFRRHTRNIAEGNRFYRYAS